MHSQTLRARSVSELVDAAFSLYRRDASQYIMVTAIAVVPGLIAQLILLRPAGDVSLGASLGALGVSLISMVTYALMTGVVTRMGSDVYLGSEADVATAVRSVLPKTGSLVAAGIMRAILYVLFFLLLVFPVFYAFARWFAPEAAVVLEDKDSGEALSRSSDLTDGFRWHVLRTLLLGYGIYFLLGIAIGIVGAVSDSQVVALFVQTVFTVIAYPIVGLLTMLLYYDLRIRKEGFDVEHLSRALGDVSARPAR